MMAALRGTLIDSVIFKGIDGMYPDWFDDVMDVCDFDGFGNIIFTNMDIQNSVTIEPENTVVLKNKEDIIYIMTLTEFNKSFIRIENFKAAPIEDCIRFLACNGNIELENRIGNLRIIPATDFLKYFHFPYKWYKTGWRE